MKYLTIGGELYHQVKTSFIDVFIHNCTNFQSLVDRGANVEVAGEYVTVINTSPHRHVNVRDIDNHEITSLTIATDGDLDHSQAIPVIIIMDQYSYHVK